MLRWAEHGLPHRALGCKVAHAGPDENALFLVQQAGDYADDEPLAHHAHYRRGTLREKLAVCVRVNFFAIDRRRRFEKARTRMRQSMTISVVVE